MIPRFVKPQSVARCAVLSLMVGVFPLAIGAVSNAEPAPYLSTETGRAEAAAQVMAKVDQYGATQGRLFPSSAPQGANPALGSLPPGQAKDVQGWASNARKLANQRSAAAAHRAARAEFDLGKGKSVKEREPVGKFGANDSKAKAEPIPSLDAAKTDGVAVEVKGHFSPEKVKPKQVVRMKPNRENDGSPGQARNTKVSLRKGVSTTGFRGDAPKQVREDEDWYRMNLRGDELLDINVNRTSGNLRPLLFLVDQNFNVIADSFATEGPKANLKLTATDAGTYYLIVSGWTLGDKKDTPTTGGYSLKITAGRADRDVYSVKLAAGDVLSATLNTGGWAIISGANGQEVHASNRDASNLYPTSSPLPGANGFANTNYVVPTDGTYYVEFASGSGPYRGRLEVYRHGGKKAAETKQTIFLDFDGARVNTSIWGLKAGVVELQPTRDFLKRWGLSATDEAALIEGVAKTVEENIIEDAKASGLSSSVEVDVVTSADGEDLTDDPGVTTIVIGGSMRDTGIEALGLAQSVDPGNFALTEKGLVMVDLLSAPVGDDAPSYSLNTYLTAKSDRLGFVIQGVGNSVSHELGHMLGSYDSDGTNGTASLMDQAGEIPAVFGVGKDRVGGTSDDTDVDFAMDSYAEVAGFFGLQDSSARSTWAVSK